MRGRILRDENGTAMVETAFVLPVIALLAVGIVAFGQVLFAYQHLSGATRAGARYATKADYDHTRPVASPSQRPSAAEVQQMTTDDAKPLNIDCGAPLNPCPDVSVQVTSTDPSHAGADTSKAGPGDEVQLTAQGHVDDGAYQLVASLANGLAGFFGGDVLPSSLRIHSRSVAVYE